MLTFGRLCSFKVVKIMAVWPFAVMLSVEPRARHDFVVVVKRSVPV